MNAERVLEAKGSATVLTILAKLPLREFVRQACDRKVGALLAVDEKGQIVGIISERDILRRVNTGTNFDKTPIADVMTREIASIGPKDDINKAMDLMVMKSIRHLPVLDGGKVCGLITVRDIMRAMRKADEDDIRYLIDYLQESMNKERTSL